MKKIIMWAKLHSSISGVSMINKDCANNKNRLFTLINGKKYLIHIHEKPFI